MSDVSAGSGITAGLAEHGTSAAWAGSFECSGPCGRKRLVGAEFSKKQVEKRQKDLNASIMCKQCVEAKAAEERKEVEQVTDSANQ